MAAPPFPTSPEHWLQAAEVAEELLARDQARQTRWRECLLSLLEVADALDRLGSALGRGLPPASAEVRQVQESCLLISRRFASALAVAGVVPMRCVGAQADPHQHVIIETRTTTQAKPGTILEEVVRGYLVDGEPLRQPQVVVAQSPSSPS